MSPPVASAQTAAPIATNPAASALGGGGSFSSFIDMDLDQFILKDTNNNDLISSSLGVCDNELTFKNFLSTSPTNVCSSSLNNNLFNSNEFDLFKFDKLTSNFPNSDLFEFDQYGGSMITYSSSTNNANNTFNLNENSTNIHSRNWKTN
jgi:hypothetical protein